MDGMGWMDGMDGLMGWMDGVSKVSFNFLHSSGVYRSCIYLLIYSKIVNNILMCFKIRIDWGVVTKNFKITAGR